jgi:hypothetical protein
LSSRASLAGARPKKRDDFWAKKRAGTWPALLLHWLGD